MILNAVCCAVDALFSWTHVVACGFRGLAGRSRYYVWLMELALITHLDINALDALCTIYLYTTNLSTILYYSFVPHMPYTILFDLNMLFTPNHNWSVVFLTSRLMCVFPKYINLKFVPICLSDLLPKRSFCVPLFASLMLMIIIENSFLFRQMCWVCGLASMPQCLSNGFDARADLKGCIDDIPYIFSTHWALLSEIWLHQLRHVSLTWDSDRPPTPLAHGPLAVAAVLPGPPRSTHPPRLGRIYCQCV